MSWKLRADGPVSATSVHARPSHSHVSFCLPTRVSPPNSTTRWRAASYAIACPLRGLGPISCFCVQSQRPLMFVSEQLGRPTVCPMIRCGPLLCLLILLGWHAALLGLGPVLQGGG